MRSDNIESRNKTRESSQFSGLSLFCVLGVSWGWSPLYQKASDTVHIALLKDNQDVKTKRTTTTEAASVVEL